MTLHRILPDPPHNDKRSSPEMLRYLKDVQLSANNLAQGRTNNTGTVTLTASSATTTLSDNLLDGQRVVVFMPTTANAAAEIGNGTMYWGTPGAGALTINHANNAQVDRTFSYLIFG